MQIREHPAIQDLAQSLRGQCGQPILFVAEYRRPAIHYGDGALMHCPDKFDPNFQDRRYTLGILESEELIDGTGEHAASVGIALSRASTKREGFDGVEVAEGPFWVSTTENQVSLGVLGGSILTFCGSRSIEIWLINCASGKEETRKRLGDVCLLARAIKQDPRQWEGIETLIHDHAEEIRKAASAPSLVIQTRVKELLNQEARLGGQVALASGRLNALNKCLLDLTGETIPAPVIFPPFEKPPA